MSSKFSTWAFVVLLLFSLVLVIHLLFGFITPIVMAMVIVSLFSPLYLKIRKAVGNREYLAASIATILVFLGVFIPITAFLIIFVQQGLALFQKTQLFTTTDDIAKWMSSLKEYLDSFNKFLARFDINISTARVLKVASSLTHDIGTWFYESIGVMAANLLALVGNFILTLALVFIFFVSGRATKSFVMELVPMPENEKERLVKRFRDLSFAVFIGNGLISVLEGALGGFSCLAFGVYGALIWGVAMAITSFLPVIGAFVIVIPATIYLFLVENTWQAIGFLLFNSIQLILLEAMVKPRLIGTKSQMHAALVFLSIMAGVQIYGVFGLFYGPLLVTIFLAMVEIYKEHYREQLLKKETMGSKD